MLLESQHKSNTNENTQINVCDMFSLSSVVQLLTTRTKNNV